MIDTLLGIFGLTRKINLEKEIEKNEKLNKKMKKMDNHSYLTYLYLSDLFRYIGFKLEHKEIILSYKNNKILTEENSKIIELIGSSILKVRDKNLKEFYKSGIDIEYKYTKYGLDSLLNLSSTELIQFILLLINYNDKEKSIKKLKEILSGKSDWFPAI